MKRVKTILLAGSDESTTIQQLWTSTKCNKNALTSQQSEHFWLLCNMLGCSVQDILAPDISRSHLSKVDGMGYGYSSHHLCGKVHRHDQQSIVSNKLPRLPLSWVIRSFFLLHLFEIEMKNNEISLQLYIIYQFLATINLSAFYGTTCPGIGLKV